MTRIDNLRLFPLRPAVSRLWLHSCMMACTVAALVPAASRAASPTENATADGGTTTDIIVTATRRETRLQDTPVSMVAVSGDTVVEQGIKNLQELSQQTPGFVMGSNALFGYNAAMRGIDSPASGIGADMSVGFYVDGVFLGRNSSGVFGLANIERVEILKGPQGTLFGRNAAAGAVIVTTSLPTQKTRINFDASYGNFADLTVRGALSGGLTDTLSASFAVYNRHVDSYANRNSLTGLKSRPGEETNFRGVLRWQPDSRTDIILRADAGVTDEDPNWPDVVQLPGYGATYATVTPGAIQATYPHFRDIALNENTYMHRRQNGVSLELNRVLGDGIKLTSLSAYRTSFSSFLLDSDGGPLRVARSWMQNEPQDQFSQEVRLASSDSSKVQWLAGLYYFREHATSDYFIDRFSRNDELALHPINTTNSYAAYGEASFSPLPRLRLKAGARYVVEQKDFANTELTIANPDASLPLPRIIPFPADQQHRTSKSWSQLTPKFVADYKYNDDVMVFASAQKGFKSGGNNFTSSDFATNPTFDPEVAWSYELGLRSQWFNRRLKLNLTGFYMDYRGLQLRINPGPGQLIIRNAANAISKGIELESEWAITRSLSLLGSFTLLKSTFRDYRFAVAGAGACLNGSYDAASHMCSYSGNELQRSPPFKGVVGLKHRWGLGRAEILSSLAYSYTSRQYYDDRNLLGPGAYGNLNAFLAVRPQPGLWSLGLWGKNLTNERHYDHLLPLNPAILGTPNAPRTYGVTATFQY